MIAKTDSRTAAVVYLRMSSKKQDKSIPAQRVEVERYAKQHGFNILREYIDEGISGSESDKRDGFQRLMKDASGKGDFRVILCWDQDRFSRFDPLEANHYWYLLRQSDVRIVTVRQGELDLAELGGWLVASINQHGKAQYLKDLSANVLRGRLRKAEKGLWAGSKAPFGYALTADGRLVLGSADDVSLVKRIFKTYAERDISLRELADKLNDEGIKSPSGKFWKGAIVRTILTREAYRGEATQFRETKGKFYTVSNGAVSPSAGKATKDRGEWFKVKCPPLVDKATWERVAAKMLRRRTATSPTLAGKGLLNGLLYCGHCGARMYVYRKPLDSSGDVIYCCATYNNHGRKPENRPDLPGCHRNIIHQAQMVPFLVGKIQELLLAPANVDRLRDAIRLQASSGHGDGAKDIARLRARVAKLDRDIRDAAKELKRTPDDLYELAVEDLRELRTERDRVAASLEASEAASAKPMASADKRAQQAIAGIQRLAKAITSADPEIAREALAQTVERIEVWFNHVKHAKLVRSEFSRGIVTFRKPSGLIAPATRPC